MKLRSTLAAWLLALGLGLAPAAGHAGAAPDEIARLIAPAGRLGTSFSEQYRPGAGPETVQFEPAHQLHNRLLLGGLLVWSGLIFGGLLYFSRRRASGLVIVGAGVVVGLVLMAQSLGWIGV
jgi:hypothetical protein